MLFSRSFDKGYMEYEQGTKGHKGKVKEQSPRQDELQKSRRASFCHSSTAAAPAKGDPHGGNEEVAQRMTMGLSRSRTLGVSPKPAL